MSFSSEIDGHKIIVDADKEFGGDNNGPRPKKLLLVALAGCTGMDVVSLMNKMRVIFSGLKIQINAIVNNEHPKKFNVLTIKYVINGNRNDFEKIEKAVKLSEEKYCGVWATLKPGVKIDYEIEII